MNEKYLIFCFVFYLRLANMQQKNAMVAANI